MLWRSPESVGIKVARMASIVGAIAIDGLHVMARGDFSDIVENYIGRTLSGSELTELVERLANRVKAKFP